MTDAELRPAAGAALSVREALDGWERLRVQAVNVLLAEQPDAAWVGRLRQLADALVALGGRYPDLSLYYLLNEQINGAQHYCALHALSCALIVQLGAPWLQWDEEQTARGVRAALSMNIAMSRLQDQLALQDGPLSETQRTQIDDHAQRGATLLEQAGVDDAVWLSVVRGHHAPQQVDDAAARAVADWLYRVDVYAAKLSRRRTRAALTPAIAARDACIGDGGRPDALGAVLLRVLGLYPPGSYVELVGGELGVVVQRGALAHQPVVALLRRADGAAVAPPRRRDTAQRGLAVRRGVDPDTVRARHAHESVLRALD